MGDKYHKQRALAQLFKELRSRTGSDQKASSAMDCEIGTGWATEVQPEDQGSDMLSGYNTPSGSGPKLDTHEKHELYSLARQLAKKLDIPTDSLEFELYEDGDMHTEEEEMEEILEEQRYDSEINEDGSVPNDLVDILRKLADQLENS